MAQASDDSWTLARNNLRFRAINDFYPECCIPTQSVARKFTYFQRLPTKIRWKVWKNALRPRRRLIGVLLAGEDWRPGYLPQDADMHPQGKFDPLSAAGKTGVTGYRFQVETVRRLDNLLFVCSESNHVVRNSYRVHMRCNVGTNSGKVLLFNPEWDILEPRVCNGQDAELLVRFLVDLRSKDPQHIGVRHLSIRNDVHTNQLPRYPHKHDTGSLQAFQAIIANLDAVLFSSAATVQPRLMTAFRTRFNRSFPLAAPIEDFELLPTDPRRIDADLRHVAVGRDPRRLHHAWQQMLHAFSIPPPTNMTASYLLQAAAHTDSPIFLESPRSSIRSRTAASTFLAWEEDQWRRICNPRDRSVYTGIIRGDPNSEEILRSAPVPAFGFWLFPMDAFDAYAAGWVSGGRLRWQHQTVMDLTRTRPKLGLAYF